MTAKMTLGARVALELEDHRFTAANERVLQVQIGERLEGAFPGAFVAEFSLPRIEKRTDRPDFFAARFGIVVEVKYAASGGSVKHVVEQLGRYAEHSCVRFIVFATPSRRVASSIPEELGGVPISRVVLMTGL